MLRRAPIFFYFVVCSLLSIGTAAAQDAEPEVTVSRANAVEVKGVLPGPGFWKIRQGENTLWLLATVRPVPKKMEWETIKLERVMATADVLIAAPSLSMDADIGFFGKIGLLPSLLKARKNPDGKTLSEVLPPATYQRWLGLKQKYLGKDKDIEYWRPIFVAQELYQAAIKQAGLQNFSPVWPVAEKLADRRKLPIERPQIKVKVANPKQLIQDFNRQALNDSACFEKTLDSIERDVQFMAQRGTLWAVGNVRDLQKMSFTDTSGACINALLNTGVLDRLGQGDLKARVENAWLSAAEDALKTRRNSVAILNMADVVGPSGYLARLRAKGYTVEEPADLP